MAISSGLDSKAALPPAVFTDFSSLQALRNPAAGLETAGEGTVDGEAGQLEEAARQFSSIFLHMALKSMREASFGGGLLDSQQSEFYRDMFDQQIALDLSTGEGFGLTQVIVDQLSPERFSATELPSGERATLAYERVARESVRTKDESSVADTEAIKANSTEADAVRPAESTRLTPDAYRDVR